MPSRARCGRSRRKAALRRSNAPFSHVRGSFDRGVALPVGHMSIWFRQAAGFSPNDRSEPFANFFFGGFGNNYVDRGNEKRYRETYSMPGAELNEIGGRNFVKSMVELNLAAAALRRVWARRASTRPWMRPAVFVGGLATNLDDRAARRVVYNAGAQLDFSISALSVLDLTLSVGAALSRSNAGTRLATKR